MLRQNAYLIRATKHNLHETPSIPVLQTLPPRRRTPTTPVLQTCSLHQTHSIQTHDLERLPHPCYKQTTYTTHTPQTRDARTLERQRTTRQRSRWYARRVLSFPRALRDRTFLFIQARLSSRGHGGDRDGRAVSLDLERHCTVAWLPLVADDDRLRRYTQLGIPFSGHCYYTQ